MISLVSYTRERPNDYKYDPVFTFSGPKDYYKAAYAAKLRSAKYAIRPIFNSMFSALPSIPSYKLIMRKSNSSTNFDPELKPPPSVKTGAHKVHGTHYFKFYSSPIISMTAVPQLAIPDTPTTFRSAKETLRVAGKKNVKVQTKYRETSAQTSPWEPDFVVMTDTDPEILKLDFLKWGSGLPCGAHEVTLIQRARMKREWEKNLPPCDGPESLAKRVAVVNMMERDEWAFREQQIEEVQDLRLHLLELMLEELHEKSHERTEKKLKMYCEMKEREMQEKIASVKRATDREKRRLTSNYRNATVRYSKVNIIDEHILKKSEIYAPLMRHGEHPKRWHQVIDEHLKVFKTKFRDVELYSAVPKWLNAANKIKVDTLKLPGTRLCVRETKWTMPVLKQLHETLKNLNQNTKPTYSLRVKIEKSLERILTPEVDSITDTEEHLHQACILIQSAIRGRASQKLIYDGQERCKELINELKNTQGLLNRDKKKVFAQKLEVQYKQQEHQLCLRSALRIKEGLKKIQGSVIGTMLDFLSKELRRLLDERKAHAMCLLYERERQMREAAESRRRQLELRRRQEHDEIFKQVIKVHQDTVDLYLQDIITEGIEFTSDKEAKKYIQTLATKIDEGLDVEDEISLDEQEEMIADLVHNFVLPEVEKQYAREIIKKRQAKYLKTVHETIYNKMEQLPKPEESETEEEEEEEEETEEEEKSKHKHLGTKVVYEAKDAKSSSDTAVEAVESSEKSKTDSTSTQDDEDEPQEIATSDEEISEGDLEEIFVRNKHTDDESVKEASSEDSQDI